MSGKGSSPRPFDVSQEEFAANHARIFGERPKKQPYVPPPLPKSSYEPSSTEEESHARLMEALESYTANTKGSFNEEGFIVLDTPFLRMKNHGG